MKALKFFLTLFISFATAFAYPCSRVLWTQKKQDVIVGRNMDWFEEIGSNMWLLPRGISRDGLASENSLKWTSKYGSVILSVYDKATADGMNEKGLVTNLLYLSESQFGARNAHLPGLSVSLWAQYFLDNFATVSEAISAMEKKPFQVLLASVNTSQGAQKGTVHLALADKTGDSAVIEYLNGQIRVYHGKQYTVMTNSPPYDQQLTALKQYKGFGGTKPLPGTTDAADRFVRSAYYVTHLPTPMDYRGAVAGVLSVLRNVSQPFGSEDPARPYISTTRWRTIADSSKGLYYYENTLSPYLVWVDFSKLNFNKGAEIKEIALVKNYNLMGDISDQFKKAPPFDFLKPDASAIGNKAELSWK